MMETRLPRKRRRRKAKIRVTAIIFFSRSLSHTHTHASATYIHTLTHIYLYIFPRTHLCLFYCIVNILVFSSFLRHAFAITGQRRQRASSVGLPAAALKLKIGCCYPVQGFFLLPCVSTMSSSITINIKPSSDKKFSVTLETSKTVLDLKNAIAEQTDVPAERQRLIYSGRVLKDHDTIADCKISNESTVHMVKGSAPGGNKSAGRRKNDTRKEGNKE